MTSVPPAENDFCAGCGLCCDGTLFSRAPVGEDEECSLAAHGLDLFELNGERQFRQPCPMLKEGHCSIYESRPKVCRDYRCKMLKRHEHGELEPGEGRRRVAEAKALRSAVVARDPEGAMHDRRHALWRSLTDAVTKASGNEKEELARRLLAVAAFETYVRQWFRSKSS